MNCNLELVTNRDDVVGIYTCKQCDRNLPIPHKLASTVKRKCTEAQPAKEGPFCVYQGAKTGKRVDCGCSQDTSIVKCSHSANAKGQAVLNLPTFRSKWDSWACSTCEHRNDKQEPIKVCFFTPGFWMGGAERWIVSLAKNFDTTKVKAVAVVVRDKGQKNAIMSDALPRWVEFIEGSEHLAETANKCDVLISWGCHTLPELTKGVTVPIIDVHHGANNNGYMADLVKASFESGAKVVAVSDACRLQFGDKWPNVTLVSNGADIDRVVPKEGRDAIRAKLGVLRGENLVACVSRIMPDKRIEMLCEAVARLPSNVKLLLVGPQMHYGPDDQRRWRKYLPGRLTILPEANHVGDYLAAADCFALASPSEAHPLAVNEAWLCGLPVAMFRLPWVEWLEQQHGPMVYDAPNKSGSTGLSKAISEALTDAKQIGPRAKAIAWERYTGAAMAGRWEEYLSEALTRR